MGCSPASDVDARSRHLTLFGPRPRRRACALLDSLGRFREWISERLASVPYRRSSRGKRATMRRPLLAFSMSAVTLVGLAGFGVVSSASAATQSAAIKLPVAVQPPKGKPAFSATFSGKLNTKVWDTCYPSFKQNSKYPGCTNLGNTEYEWYTRSQVRVAGGLLHLTAERERVTGVGKDDVRKVYGCRSGMVTSYPGYRFEYGFVQVVARLPHTPGVWPALWLAAANLKWPPEMDLVETWGVNGHSGAFFHPVNGKYVAGHIPLARTEGWQTYSLRWTPSKITYYVGNSIVLTITKGVPHQKMYFIADLAEYQPAVAGKCSGQLQIKSVKVWKN